MDGHQRDLAAPPSARVNQSGARRLRAGIPWVYRTDIAQAPSACSGQVVRVLDQQGNFIGQAFWAINSPIALRLLTRQDQRLGIDFFQERIKSALARRKMLQSLGDGYRAVHGEADLLPGLFVDVYAQGITIQTLSEGMNLVEPRIVEILDSLLKPRFIALRNDGAARDFEGLKRCSTLAKGQAPAQVQYREGENVFEIDLLDDLKTGSFLDQRENHLRVAQYAQGDGLDCFTYHGGFALAMSGRCRSVLAVDQLEDAVQKVRANVARNQRANVEAHCANAFDLLREFERQAKKFDIIVIDPPAFAKRKEGLFAAQRAYKELNLRALRLLRSEGILVSCSCSGKMTPAHFGDMLQAAIQDAKRPVQILERHGAGRDHPVLAGLPETEYLKCWIIRVL